MAILTGGGQLTRRPHLLSRDGKLLLVCVANNVRAYSSVTGELLFTLQGHTDEVTCLATNPAIGTQVYSGSRDGTLKLWDLEDATEIKSFEVISEPIESMAIVGTTAFLTCHWREFQAGRLLQFDLVKGAAQDSRTKLSKPRQVVASLNGNLVATFDRHTVMAWLPEEFTTSAPLTMHHTKAITCLTLSPDGGRLAAGDATGRIVIWHDVASRLTARAARRATLTAELAELAGAVDGDIQALTGADQTTTTTTAGLDSNLSPSDNDNNDNQNQGVVLSTDTPMKERGEDDEDDDDDIAKSGNAGLQTSLAKWDAHQHQLALAATHQQSQHMVAYAAHLEQLRKLEEQEQEEEEPASSTVHWHAHAVGCLTFSTDGAYLLSGGQEAVLVMWEAASGRRGYLPRLGGPLTGIAGCVSDPAKFALRQADNTLRVINSATMRVECSIHGLRPLPRGLPSNTPAPTAVQPSTGHIVLAGPHTMLQWYDVTRDAHIDKLQLSQRNLVSLTDADAQALTGAYGPPKEPCATAVAFSADGSVLATAEIRPDPAGGGATQHCLKFWDKLSGGAAQYGTPYRLNTVADQPHRSTAGFGAITSLSYHPSDDLVVTTSDAAEFKLWTRQRLRVHSTSIEGGRSKNTAGTNAGTNSTQQVGKRVEDSTWRCAAVAGYRGEALSASAFSSDGSLLAIGSTNGSITLWNVASASLLCALPPALPTTNTSSSNTNTTSSVAASAVAQLEIKQLVFLSGCPTLVTANAVGVAVYDLLTLRCEWSGALHGLGGIAADPVSPHWAMVLPAASSSTSQKANNNENNNFTSAEGGGEDGNNTNNNAGVVIFRGGDKKPVGGWKLQRTIGLHSSSSSTSVVSGQSSTAGTVSLVFAVPGTPLHTLAASHQQQNSSMENASSTTSVSMSPLVVLTPNREFAVATGAALRGNIPAVHASSQPLTRRRDTFAPSGFEAMYGKLDPGALGAAAAGAVNVIDVEMVGKKGGMNVSALFDGPSHALPPMRTLCPAFLEMMILGGGPSGEGDQEKDTDGK